MLACADVMLFVGVLFPLYVPDLAIVSATLHDLALRHWRKGDLEEGSGVFKRQLLLSILMHMQGGWQQLSQPRQQTTFQPGRQQSGTQGQTMTWPWQMQPTSSHACSTLSMLEGVQALPTPSTTLALPSLVI